MTDINSPHKKSRVLVVDDDFATRLLYHEALEPAGFEVIEASDGLSALSSYKDSRPDIILLDVVMPNMNGFQTCEALLALDEWIETPIIMVTGLDDFDSIEQANNLGATDFITKPINWPILKHRLNFILKASNAFKELKSKEEKIRHLAYYDSLTGLPNRQFFREQLKIALKHVQREKKNLYVMFLDLDDFKKVNDSLGHDAGDALLKAFSKKLLSVIRDTDFAAHDSSAHHEKIEMSRLGGDEFTILLHDVSAPRVAGVVAERIISSLKTAFNINSHEIYASTSIGISAYPEDGETAEALLKHADMAMYHAKTNGKNNYAFFNSTTNAHIINKLTMENELRRAIHNDELVLHYQPRVDLITGRILGAEALIRWQHPTRGLVYPNDFIPLAEESRLIIPLGEWVINSACKQIKLWEDTYKRLLPVSINISPLQFYESELDNVIGTILSDTHVPSSLVELEITETALMKNLEQTIPLMQRFKDIGIRLAIDDFGTGYSVLNTLRHFPIDVLKIDQAFIQGLPQDNTCRVICESIIHLCKGMNFEVVAEGVETEQQQNFLSKYQGLQAQGYYFSKPISVDAFSEILSKTLLEPETTN